MKFTYSLPVALVCAFVVVVQSQKAIASIPQQVRDIADKITVRIDGADTGSGIIIKGEGNTYTVLTCWHVVDKRGNYTVKTGTGRTYQVNYSTVKRIGNIDLAEFQFTSNENYRPVEIGNSSQVTAGSTVYAFGWAAPDQVSKGREYVPLETTARVVSQPVDEYALVLINTVKPGMSGGPILDEQGRLIGVSGQARTDGRTGAIDFLGIPVNTYKQVASASDRNRNVPRTNTNQQPVTGVAVSTGTTKKAEEFFKQGEEKFEKSDYQGAINSLTEAIGLDSKYVEAYSLRGSAYSNIEDNKKATDDWQKSANLFAAQGNNSASKRDQGRIRHLSKDYQGAIALYNEAIRLNPKYDRA
ncbi:MAG: tetratricopeptide repeat-containing serine protease family protein [Cuspidothrix sp.]